jgi:hypothetical protein
MANEVNESQASPKIVIDGKSYSVDQLSAEARKQVVNVRVADQEIQRLQVQMALAQTARAAYARALAEELGMTGTAPEGVSVN